MRAWWSGTIDAFRLTKAAEILGLLSTRLIEAHTINHAEQVLAWRQQIDLLKEALAEFAADGRILLEYPLLRLGRRIDTVLVTSAAVFVLEFKMHGSLTEADRRQVEDYALDLQDFHSGSRSEPIIPVLVSSEAIVEQGNFPLFWQGVAPVVFMANRKSLQSTLTDLHHRIHADQMSIAIDSWEAAPYRPVPTSVDAARLLYARHGIAELRTARADVENLSVTRQAIAKAIVDAKQNNRHLVIFVTGIPGAGKTLCGLDAIFSSEDPSAFLTGNFPLIFVMRAALERDARQQGRSVRVAKQETESAIQPLMGFLKDNLEREAPPHEHVIVFDEAQRAWDAAFGARKFGHPQSEAAMFLDIMQKHQDWSVIVALVGNGQEINTGEAGLAAWGDALAERVAWKVLAPPAVVSATDPRQKLGNIGGDRLAIASHFHLDVAVRSIRSNLGNAWVEAVLFGDRSRAAQIAGEAVDFPFLLTRSLSDMRQYLRRIARGERRTGLVCSAGARRLRADGVDPNFAHMDADTVANWFLNWWPDVRASDALEVPATQFGCQGLELDYVGLCWGNDMIRTANSWICRRFTGSRWQNRRTDADIAFCMNTYRVLLTRARYKTVIWVPPGAIEDRTRDPETFDAIAMFFQDCGIPYLQNTHLTSLLEDDEASLFGQMAG
jgi:hypothetical protein